MGAFKATCIKSVDREILICNSCNGNCVKNGKTGSANKDSGAGNVAKAV